MRIDNKVIINYCLTLKNNIMTVRELIKHSDLEFSDIADFIDGSDGFEATRDEMANATGIDHPMIDIDGGTAKGEEILDADIIENTPL